MKYCILLISLLSFSPPSIGLTATISVDCNVNGDYTTIQEGVDAATDGDTITVAPCTYVEHVVVPNRPLVIIGGGSHNTIHKWEGYVAVRTTGIRSSPLEIRGMTIQREPQTDDAIWVNGLTCRANLWARKRLRDERYTLVTAVWRRA